MLAALACFAMIVWALRALLEFAEPNRTFAVVFYVLVTVYLIAWFVTGEPPFRPKLRG